MPIATSGSDMAAIFTLNPIRDIIHAVTVVPTFAPMITPIDCASVISPALTKLTTMTVVALDDCISAVTRIPVNTPMTLFFVMAASTERSLSPANFSRPSLIVFIPKRNKPSEPISESRFSNVSICVNYAVLVFVSCSWAMSSSRMAP